MISDHLQLLACAVLRRFVASCGALRHFAAFLAGWQYVSSRDQLFWGGKNPSPLFCLVEINRSEIGGPRPPLPPEKNFWKTSVWP